MIWLTRLCQETNSEQTQSHRPPEEVVVAPQDSVTVMDLDRTADRGAVHACSAGLYNMKQRLRGEKIKLSSFSALNGTNKTNMQICLCQYNTIHLEILFFGSIFALDGRVDRKQVSVTEYLDVTDQIVFLFIY